MSVSPDEGMQLLSQRYAANQAVAQAALPPEPHDGNMPAASGLDIMARLAVALESNTAALTAQAARQRRFEEAWGRVAPIEIPPQQSQGAGTLQDPDRWGPGQGWAWRLFGWTVVLGAGTTAASVWLDSPNDPTNLLFTTGVSGRWEPSHFYLMPERNLVWTSVGGGITVCKGNAVQIAINDLPLYMGFKG